MRAEIVAIGTELLQGDLPETNSLFLAEALAHLGVEVVFKTIVGDQEAHLEEALRTALDRVPLVLTTGGLGPTEDDVTKKVLARVLGRRLVFREEVLQALRQRPGWGEREIPRALERQALIPSGAQILSNPVGTAPGLWLEVDKRLLVALPGVPHEMREMFQGEVRPRLQQWIGGYGVYALRVLHTFGVPEARINDALQDLLNPEREPRVGLAARPTGVDIRVQAFGRTREEAQAILEAAEQEIRSRLGEAVYGVDGARLEAVVGQLLRDRGWRLAVAESCTGGLIGHRITEVAGSSDYFQGGVVVYSNAAKETLLGVPGDLLASQGAVSDPVARAMAEGVRRRFDTEVGIGVTGIAGPGGGTPTKPVGLVYVAWALPEGTRCQRLLLEGTREAIKWRASQHALDGLRRSLQAGSARASSA